MQQRAVFAREKQTNGVHRCNAKAGMDKDDLKLVLCLNLFLYTSHPYVNPEYKATLFFIRLFSGKPGMNYVRPTRIALGHFPSWQIEVNSWPNSFPLLRVWPVHSLSWWGPESLYEQDVQDGL